MYIHDCVQELSFPCSPLQKLTTTLQCNWEKTSDGDVVTRFQFAAGSQQITASPKEMAGPGWTAAVYGQEAVRVMAYHCIYICGGPIVLDLYIYN